MTERHIFEPVMIERRPITELTVKGPECDVADVDLACEVVETLHSLHGFPELTVPCEIIYEYGESRFGQGSIYLPFGSAVDTIIHEVGHMVDWALLDDERVRPDYPDDLYLTDAVNPLINTWREAVTASPTFRRSAFTVSEPATTGCPLA